VWLTFRDSSADGCTGVDRFCAQPDQNRCVHRNASLQFNASLLLTVYL
jgi:hypothetical protein